MMNVFSCSEPGGHPENEDAFEICPHPQDSNCHLGVIADGQGGRAGGRAAARLACKTFIESASRLSPQRLLQPRTWGRLLHTVDRTVCDHPVAGFTTLVVFLVHGRYLCGASCGDSGLAIVQAGSPGKILTARQLKNPPVGSGCAAFVDFASSLTHPWTVLGMTDGVWKYAGWDFILQAANGKNGAEIIEMLRDKTSLARTGQFQDDFTLIVLQE